jgi:hypothetical protein
MESSTLLAIAPCPRSEEQEWIDTWNRVDEELACSPEPVVEDESEYYFTKFHDYILIRREVQPSLNYATSICMHLHHILTLIRTYGEEALSAVSYPESHFDLQALLRDDIPEETTLEKAQHSFSVHHTAICECLKRISRSCDLPSYRDFSDKRNWFYHVYCTPDAEINRDGTEQGMKWAVKDAKKTYEDLLLKVITTISELKAVSANKEAWRPAHLPQWGPSVGDREGEENEAKSENSDSDNDNDDHDADSTFDTSYHSNQPMLSANPTIPDYSYPQYDDGCLIRPLRALYFRSRLCRTVMGKICDFTWNRMIEYCSFHGVDTPEETDG